MKKAGWEKREGRKAERENWDRERGEWRKARAGGT